MGAAAYRRGSKAIADRISLEARPPEFELMDILNALQKYPDAGLPFGPIQFVPFRGGWFAECPKSGYGFFYSSLYEAVKRWKVQINGFSHGSWLAVPVHL